MNLGEGIRHAREQKGLSQTELAKRIRISRSALSQLECGKTTKVKAENVFPLARELDFDPGALAEGRIAPVSESLTIAEVR